MNTLHKDDGTNRTFKGFSPVQLAVVPPDQLGLASPLIEKSIKGCLFTKASIMTCT